MFKKLFRADNTPLSVFTNELLKKQSDIKLLQKMLDDKSVDINHLNENGESFLHIVLRSKKLQNALWLLSKNIKPNIKDNGGVTPFDIAINNQYHRVVRALLQKIKVDLNKKNEFGRTVLQDSVILGDHEMAKILIEHGADINIVNNQNRNVLYDALSYNNEDFLDFLLQFDKLELNNIAIDQSSVFNHKSVRENPNLAMKLIAKGADPTMVDKHGRSFLYECALNGIEGLQIINFAVQKGFNINAQLRDNETILMSLVNELLSLKNNEDEEKRKSIRYIIKELVTKGLHINAVDIKNETVLFKAIRANDEMLTKLLLDLKIDVNIQNHKKQTALAIAVYQGTKSFNLTLELLKHKADPTIKSIENKTLFEEINDIILQTKYPQELWDKDIDPKHLVAQYTNTLRALLKYYKKNLNFLDSRGNPLFYKPLMYHNTPLFYLYANKGLDIHKLNKDGHNLFFEYVVKVFEDNVENVDIQGALSILISAKVNHNRQDETGWTAVSKIVATTPCNIKLFKTLIRIVKFDYTIVDKLGRTVVHSAVWKGNRDIVKIINIIDSSIKDIPDNYGILPITYAALLGNQELVLTFISMKAKTTTDVCVVPGAVKKFSPMLKNLDKLTHNIKNKLLLRQVNDVIEAVKSDFELECYSA